MSNRVILRYFLYIILLIALDQTSKNFLISYLKTRPDYIQEILPFFDLVYVWNYGISFGLFQEYYRYANIIFLGINSIIIIYLTYLLTQSRHILVISGLIFIIGGALGNLIDRIKQGAVFDFLCFHYNQFYFPAFNLADSFITIGAMIFIQDYLFCRKLLDKK